MAAIRCWRATSRGACTRLARTPSGRSVCGAVEELSSRRQEVVRTRAAHTTPERAKAREVGEVFIGAPWPVRVERQGEAVGTGERHQKDDDRANFTRYFSASASRS